MTQLAISRTDTIAFLGGITALTAISIDIILPATGVVARSFGVDEQLGALLVGVYFVAYAFGQLFWGLFSDAFGRKTALVVSLTGFILASFASAMAPSFGFLIVMRCLQGLTGGTPVIARAIVRDVISGKDAARLMAVLAAILTVATLIAPVMGSGLLILFEWRAIFVALGLLGLAFLAYTLVALDETGSRRPERFSISFIRASGSKLLTLREFLIPMSVGSFAFGGYAAILSVGAVVAETAYGVAPESFGSLFALAALSNTAGAMMVRQILKKRNVDQIGAIAVALLGVAGLVQVAILFTAPSLVVFWGAVCLYVFAFGIVLPTSIAAAMEPAGEMPGFASSLMGAIQMGVGALAALFATAIFDGSNRAVTATMALFALLGVTAYLVGHKWRRR